METVKSSSPWLSIWVNPRSTIRRIVQENPNRSLWLLAAIYGFSALLNLFQTISLGSVFSIAAILIIAVILSPIYGYISFTIWSWVVMWVGKWFKGKGTFQTIRCAYAWSCVPFTLNIPFWIWMIALFGKQLFFDFPEGHLLSDSQITMLFFILISKVILAIWSLVIYLNGLSEVQEYSILRAIGNMIVAGIIFMIFFAIVWYVLLSMLGVSVETQKTAFQFWNEGSSLDMLRRGCE